MTKSFEGVAGAEQSTRQLATGLASSVLALALFLQTSSAVAQVPAPSYASSEALGVAMEGWPYPYPLETLQFELQGQPVRMVFMDLKPERPNGQTVLLFHG